MNYFFRTLFLSFLLITSLLPTAIVAQNNYTITSLRDGGAWDDPETAEFDESSDGICDAINEQSYHQIINDGNGGAMTVWQDKRWGAFDIYAQRIDLNGNPLWQSNGVPVCTEANDQWNRLQLKSLIYLEEKLQHSLTKKNQQEVMRLNFPYVRTPVLTFQVEFISTH